MISRAKSDALFAEALNYIPGGVNSPVRAFRAVGGKPFFVNKAGGCRVWDVDGNEYIDYVGTWGPDSLGVPADFAKLTIVLPFNDTESIKAAFAANKNEIACIIVEPVPGNAGLYLPKPGYLEFLRKVTQENGALLIFDEVMTGFRLAPGGAQERFGITPDLSCFGKIIGGGLPVGAFGGRADIMDLLAPTGPVYQAGTLSGNPVAMAAGIAALQELAATN